MTPLRSVSHSQMVITRQPAARSAARFLASLETFSSNLAFQNSERVLGIVAFTQPTWRCQKHPCTKITVW